jgi:transcriptional regulator with XRE-family HTH domain
MNAVGESTTGVVALLLDDLAPARLGTLLRGARKQRSLTRRDVAGRVGTSAAELRRFERGEVPVPPSLVAALAECYGEDLTAQFATREPIQIDRRRVVVGDDDVRLATDDDEVLGTYVGIVARLRHAQPGEPIALRTDDLVALSTALGKDPEHVESRIVELLGCTAHEARSLHSELLRRKLVLPVAGLVTGLAVITGVGVAAASPNASAVHAPRAQHAVAQASSPSTHHLAVPPTTISVQSDAAPDVTAAPATTVAPAPPAPEATIAPPATDAPAPPPTAPPTTSAPAPTTPAVTPAAPAEKPPVITTDTTPMSIPAHETVTIIQP